jgi:geranyl-CoA carboxylase alpha subunit
VQRRHQKLIEEAPSLAVDAALRTRMGEAAVRAARAIGYIGAGTMEFLLDRSGAFYFMEMNTRLQVEHAVTEAITGLDLVEWQLRVARGEPLPLAQDAVRLEGHAIEARLTAEDVAAGFLPQSGLVLRWRAPGADHDVRVDHGLREGGAIPPHYDSMVAKLIAHGRTRDEARAKLCNALRDCVLLGVASNQAFLADCLAHPAFADGDVHTGFIAQHMGDALAPARPGAHVVAAAASCRVGWLDRDAMPLGRNTAVVELESDVQRWRVELRYEEDQAMRVTVHWQERSETLRLRLLQSQPDGVWWLECDGLVHRVVWARDGEDIHLLMEGRTWRFQLPDPHRTQAEKSASGAITAPLTGRIAAVNVGIGDLVRAGQPLVVLEAMKMEHSLCAPFTGRVTELSAQAGGQARAGAKLVQMLAVEEPAP